MSLVPEPSLKMNAQALMPMMSSPEDESKKPSSRKVNAVEIWGKSKFGGNHGSAVRKPYKDYGASGIVFHQENHHVSSSKVYQAS